MRCPAAEDGYRFPPISDDIYTEYFVKILSAQEHIPCRAMMKGRDIYVET